MPEHRRTLATELRRSLLVSGTWSAIGLFGLLLKNKCLLSEASSWDFGLFYLAGLMWWLVVGACTWLYLVGRFFLLPRRGPLLLMCLGLMPGVAGGLWFGNNLYWSPGESPGPSIEPLRDAIREERVPWDAYADAALAEFRRTRDRGFDWPYEIAELEGFRLRLGSHYRVDGHTVVYFPLCKCVLPFKSMKTGLCRAGTPRSPLVEDLRRSKPGRRYEHLEDDWYAYEE